MKIIVTGASGYLGSQLANYLGEKHEVYAFVRNSSSLTRLKQTKVHVKKASNYSDLNGLLEIIRPDVIINTVALYGRGEESFSQLIESNISYPTHLLELASQYGVKVFINTGSSLPENINAYAATKSFFPKLANLLTCKTKFINIELEHFYGPGDDKTKFVSYVIDECLQGNTLKLTSGKQKRDFIYIDDVISAYELIISNVDSISTNKSISLGSGTAASIREVVESIYKFSNSKSNLEFGAIPERKFELEYSCADNETLKALGWKPEYSLADGLNLTISEEKK
ncbi:MULTISPECIES: NAD(P)-dependent oxidoreductase [Vibrio]|uniref:NAD-dependent epimerase/dehydratase family protein n=1 Tax=Vibrio TaxID=662 RepID=UPI00142EBEA3|nr:MULTISPECIES: NAD(P)-dependent oxidoreductase [Vibrio]